MLALDEILLDRSVGIRAGPQVDIDRERSCPREFVECGVCNGRDSLCSTDTDHGALAVRKTEVVIDRLGGNPKNSTGGE